MAALIAKTMVKEKRRTWRAIIVSAVIRRFNSWAVERLRDEEEDVAKKSKIKRAEGGPKIRLFSEYYDMVVKDITEAVAATPKATRDRIHRLLGDMNNKASAEEIRVHELGIIAGLDKDAFLSKQYAAEIVSGYEKTATMGDKITLSEFKAGKNGQGHAIMNAELIARGIPDTAEFIRDYTDPAIAQGKDVWDTINFTNKKKLLKEHEALRFWNQTEHATKAEAIKATKAFKPESDEAKQLLLDMNEAAEIENESGQDEAETA